MRYHSCEFEIRHSPTINDLCCKNIFRTDNGAGSEVKADLAFHRSENPWSPSLLPRLDVTLLLRLDLSESVRLLGAEDAAAAPPAPTGCSSLDLLLDLLPDDDVELGGRCSSDEESVFSSTWNLAVTFVTCCCVGVAHREDWQLDPAGTVVVVVSTTTSGSTNTLAPPPPQFNELCVDGGCWLELM